MRNKLEEGLKNITAGFLALSLSACAGLTNKVETEEPEKPVDCSKRVTTECFTPPFIDPNRGSHKNKSETTAPSQDME